MTAPWVDPEVAPLEGAEVVCMNCWLAYNGHLDQCPQCEFYGPASDRAPQALLARKASRSIRAANRGLGEVLIATRRATAVIQRFGEALLAGSAEMKKKAQGVGLRPLLEGTTPPGQ